LGKISPEYLRVPFLIPSYSIVNYSKDEVSL
jgi:hypothetical protein